MDVEGLITRPSRRSVRETINRLMKEGEKR